MELNDCFREQNMVPNMQTNQTRPQTQRKKKKSKKQKKRGCYGELAMAIAPELAALNVLNRQPDTVKSETRESAMEDGVINIHHKAELGAQTKGPEEVDQPFASHDNPLHSTQGLMAYESNDVSLDSVDMADVEKDKERIITHPTDEELPPMQQGATNDFITYEGVSSAVPDIPDKHLKRPYQPSKPKRCYVSLAESVAPQLAALNVQGSQDTEQTHASQNSNNN